ncbi:MAG: peroxiredoxin [Planctomycetes bacterium]|nr:peroxiredoxin [Planctomycetota bacterium]
MPTLHAMAPDFTLVGFCAGQEKTYRISNYRKHWVLLFYYPSDFSFVCPTEIQGFQRRLEDFKRIGCEILAVSTDDIASHRAWAEELGGLGFPLLSDPGGKTASAYGVLNPTDGRAFRATFVINPDGRVVYIVASPANVGRSVGETLRVVQALQTGRLCPMDWKPGDPAVDPERDA